MRAEFATGPDDGMGTTTMVDLTTLAERLEDVISMEAADTLGTRAAPHHGRSTVTVTMERGDAAFRGEWTPRPTVRSRASIDGHTVTSVVHRIAHRLLGHRAIAHPLADEQVRAAFTGEQATGHADRPADPLATATAAVVGSVLERYHEWVHSGLINADEVSHVSHRARLIRELRRHQPSAAVVLALRHLGDLDVATVSAVCGIEPSEVRAITSRWLPSDAIDDSDDLLRQIDDWIGATDRAVTTPTEADHLAPLLAHLDDHRS